MYESKKKKKNLRKVRKQIIKLKSWLKIKTGEKEYELHVNEKDESVMTFIKRKLI